MPTSKKNGTGFACEDCGAVFSTVVVYACYVGACSCAHCPKCGGSSVDFATPVTALSAPVAKAA